MSRLWVFIAFVVIATAAAAAQPIPQFDLFGGYSFGHISTGDFPRHANLNGWDASATYNWNKWFGIMVEGSGLYGSKEVAPATTIIFLCGQPSCPSPITFPARRQSNIVHTYSLGPRFSFRNHTRYTPFARALFGGGYISDSSEANGSSILTAGGGVDIGLTSRLALRTQTDFLRNRFFHQTGPDIRLATGLVFHLGHK